jgi:hypothetical protein
MTASPWSFAPREELGDKEVTEIGLLLTRQQVAALEQEAHRRGLTLSQLLRGLISSFLTRPSEERPG